MYASLHVERSLGNVQRGARGGSGEQTAGDKNVTFTDRGDSLSRNTPLEERITVKMDVQLSRDCDYFQHLGP